MRDEIERERIDVRRAVVLGVSTLVLGIAFLSLLVADQATALAF